ncbi:MAG: hypothetical protein NTZ05_11650 [Chloroflexi bacterium]|nr:hypothetical protein [Chloroflexota bacterium]
MTTMRSDRLLQAIVAGAVVLVLAGFGVLFLARERNPVQYPENTPQGVVQRYLQALSDGRYREAEAYISDSVKNRAPNPYKPSYPPSPPERSYRVVLQDTKMDGDIARVTVAVSRAGGGGPFGDSGYTNTTVFELRQENGAWRIISPEYPILY